NGKSSVNIEVFMCVFFQAEDGIRDRNVTGVQTCALPICVPDLDLPISRFVKTLQQSEHRCFSASAWSGKGNHFTGVSCKLYIFNNWLFFTVGKRNVLYVNWFITDIHLQPILTFFQWDF